LYDLDRRPRLLNVIYGLGGKDFGPEDAESAYEALMKPDVKEVWIGI
jgi:pyruvate/2-oxoacid:ferredoxin oxidoreductase alpha subunit